MTDSDCSDTNTLCGDCTSCTNNFNPIIAGLDIADRKILDKNRKILTYKKGEIIFKENILPTGLFCLNKGKVMIIKSDSHGNTIVTNLYKEVNYIGVAEYLSGLPYQSTCIALSQVTVCIIDSKIVEFLLSKNTDFSRRLLTSISNDYHQSCTRLMDITKKNMRSRIADALLLLLNVFEIDKDGYIDVYLKRSEIAQICNMNETNVIRHLSALNKLGAIRIDSKKIFVENKNLLVLESRGDFYLNLSNIKVD